MKTTSAWVLTMALVMAFLTLKSQSEMPGPDRTLSPYFYIHSDDPETEKLPLKSTTAQVSIAGIIADVAITQEYQNEGKKPIEAVYVFPASTRAAVYSMVMTIGERVIMARIEEKDRARQQYEEAKNSGQSASLLEQERPNVFTMNVANILPGDRIRVELRYTEWLLPEERVYRFIYPTVVGPRYSSNLSGLASAGEGWNANPYTLEGVEPLYRFDIDVSLNAGMAIQDLRCPTHKTVTNYKSKSQAAITLDESESQGGNRDFILEYRLAGRKIESGILLFEGENENFFLAMVQPPDRIAPEMIPPREYVFIVDVSGSMHGFPIETSKQLLRDLIGGLRSSDRFNVILFAGGSSIFSEQSVVAGPGNIASALRFIDKEPGGGGTELLPALKKALQLRGTEGYSRTFIIATDGYVSVEKEAFELVRSSLGEANFFAFGIGSSVNHYLIEGLAHAGQGEPFTVTGRDEAAVAAAKFRQYISTPALTGIDIVFDGFPAYDLAQDAWPDLFSSRPVIVFGKYKGAANGSIVLTGQGGDGRYQQRLDLASADAGSDLSALRYLWAREKIRTLDDFAGAGLESPDNRDEVTRLGLEYNLLTRYTSFIAIDTEVRNGEGNSTTVRQPLPLPQGVSNHAVGGVFFSRSLPAMINKDEKALGALNMVAHEEYELADVSTKMIETYPSFQGGDDALKAFIRTHLRYPEESRKNGITGNVIVEFTVDTDGSVKDIRILYSLDEYTDREVIRVVKLMSGKWTPGERNGRKRPMKVMLTGLFHEDKRGDRDHPIPCVDFHPVHPGGHP